MYSRTLKKWSGLAIIITLTLVMTWPTAQYVFRTDVFWLPTGSSSDFFIEMWDVWYGSQIAQGRADRFFTNVMFFPNGVSLVNHPINIPYVIAVNALLLIMPVSNAFSLAYMLIIFTCALGAYWYLLWLLRDRWLAVFGAAIFGCSPHVIGHVNHPNNALVATIPLAVYCFHRGFVERRRGLVLAAGLVAGATSIINIYAYVCLVMTLGLGGCALAWRRWREREFWRLAGLFAIALVLASLWRLVPIVSDSQSFSAALEFRLDEQRNDLVSNFVNHQNPFFGSALDDFFDRLLPVERESARNLSPTSYLGYIPLLLIGIGLFERSTRRAMLPWLALLLLFLALRLGSVASINGAAHPGIVLPKHLLDQLFPAAFRAFVETDNFMMGAILPLAVLACMGLRVALARVPKRLSAVLVLLLLAGLAMEYAIPVRGNHIKWERLAYLEWFDGETDDPVRLINLPMGRGHSKHYTLYQSLSGYPQVEGAISRTPDEAYDYIRQQTLLRAWHAQEPMPCTADNRADYLEAVDELDATGFSHVVFHRLRPGAGAVAGSFRHARSAYEDAFVTIYRLEDLRLSCPAT